MTTYLFAGGGSAGHVNPLLAVADHLRQHEPEAEIVVLGTAEGLEARLVPARGYELVTIPRLPFPRRPSAAALRFPAAYRRMVNSVVHILDERSVELVVGFGGYAAAPAYSAAIRGHRPFVVHEGNVRPGLANRFAARRTPWVGVTFPGTPLPHAVAVGMPLRPEIELLDRSATRLAASEYFGLDPVRPTLLVTGGSLGARRLNSTVWDSAQDLIDLGWQILHIQGNRGELVDPMLDHYRLVSYCDRMELALACTDFAVARAGATTVSEFAFLGIPAVYVPFPVGNGEQRFNAAGIVAAGGGLLVKDADFSPGWLRANLFDLLKDHARIEHMATRAVSVGFRDGAERMVSLISQARAAA